MQPNAFSQHTKKSDSESENWFKTFHKFQLFRSNGVHKPNFLKFQRLNIKGISDLSWTKQWQQKHSWPTTRNKLQYSYSEHCKSKPKYGIETPPHNTTSKRHLSPKYRITSIFPFVPLFACLCLCSGNGFIIAKYDFIV